MRRSAALVAVALAVAACDDRPPILAEDLHLTISAGATDVEFGRGFPLTVVRVWSKDLVPAAWEDRALTPLAVRPVGVALRENDRRVEETRTYVGYAFAVGEVTLPPRAISAAPAGPAQPGAVRTAASAPLRFRVRPSLDPTSPGAPELPGGPLAEPFPWRGAAAAAIAAAAAAAVLVRRARRSRSAPAEAAPPVVAPPGPEAEALARLRAVRDRAPDDPVADVAEVSAIVRAYVAARFGVHAAERTTEEIDAALADLGASPRALLRDVGARADLVKFAAAGATRAGRDALVDRAERFVAETTPAGGPVP